MGHPHRPLDLDLARRAWEELRDELLPEFIREHPLTRPWAWWRFDAPEPRSPLEPEREYLTRLGLLSPEERGEAP
ncbi:MAG: hypothetical protein IT432_04775 [Phycisphaerales bacterium]|nr:hypothetical protein [Phycisphaerales bacterium]